MRGGSHLSSWGNVAQVKAPTALTFSGTAPASATIFLEHKGLSAMTGKSGTKSRLETFADLNERMMGAS